MPTRDTALISRAYIHRWNGKSKKKKSPTITEIEWSDRREGYIGITYHYVVQSDGTFEKPRPVEQIAVREAHPREGLSVLLVDGTKRRPKVFEEYLKDTYGDNIEIIVAKTDYP